MPSHAFAWIALLLSASVVVSALVGFFIARLRGWRVGVPWAMAMGLLFVALINPLNPLASQPRVALLVDVSASTRGNWFRDPKTVRAIAADLARFASVTTYTFSEDDAQPVGDLSTGDLSPWPDHVSPATSLPTTAERNIVLLSDGRLDGHPQDRRLFAIVDSSVAAARDARIGEASVERGTLVVSVQNDGADRTLRWPDGTAERVGPGESVLRRSIAREETRDTVTVSLDEADRWPENDRMTVPIPRERAEAWWIGENAPAGFTPISPSEIDSNLILRASVIVLNDVPIDSLGSESQADLTRYARDLGGSVVIGGGPRSLSAGGYGGSMLDSLSPLSSLPPTPTMDLFVIVDASGSMAAALPDGRTKLDAAIGALQSIDTIVPTTWTLRAGSVARDLRWWTSTTERRVDRPSDLAATGPTNLAAAIDQTLSLVSRETPAASDRTPRLMLISDGQVEARSLAGLADRVRSAGLIIDWLALPPASTDGPLAALVRESGGSIRAAGAADTWQIDAAALARGSMSMPFSAERHAFTLPPIGPVMVEGVNPTFLREGATSIASTQVDGITWPIAAEWSVGVGRVATVAGPLDAAMLAAFARSRMNAPFDPRFTMRVVGDAIEIDAADRDGPMNALRFVADHHAGATASPLAFEQVAPGRYRAMIARSDRPSIAVIRHDASVIGTIALPSRPPREFDAVGIDRDALRDLARSTGGDVVERDAIGTLRGRLLHPAAHTSLHVPALVAAFVSLMIALVFSRRAA